MGSVAGAERLRGLRSDGVRVLAVDDDEEFLDLTAEFLEREDERFTVVTATGAAEGLDRLDADLIDCIVSDYDMPGTDGLEFLDRVRERRPELPFILFTGKGSEEIASEAVSAGVSDYLRKGPGSQQFELLANRVDAAVTGYWAKLELDRQRDLFEKAQDIADVGAWEWYPQESEGYYSEEIRAIYGVSSRPGKTPADDIEDFYHPDDRDDIREAFERAIQTGDPYDIEVRIVDIDGEQKWVRTRGKPEVEDGETVRIRGTIRDITERVERERKLERARSRFQTLYEQLDQPLVEVEYEGVEPIVVDANPAFEDTFGYDRDAIVGESLDEYIVPPDSGGDANDINEHVVDGGSISAREVTRLTADGTRDFLLENALHEETTGGLAIYTDITDRKERERRLERQNERLERFVGVVSHDLRNPLNAAEGRLELARADCDSDHLAALGDAIERMETLIDDLLSIARDGDRVTEVEPVSLRATAQDCWETVRTEGTSLRIETDATVVADRSRLRQALENAFRNAVEHGGATVTIGDLPDGRGIYVEDDGPGIPPAKRGRAFESGDSPGGTDFGLDIIADIVAAHGWEIDATDGSTGGARLEITGVEFATE